MDGVYDLITADEANFHILPMGDSQWWDFVTALGHPDIDDPHLFGSPGLRAVNHREMERRLRRIFAQCTLKEWQEVLGKDVMTLDPGGTIHALLANDARPRPRLVLKYQT